MPDDVDALDLPIAELELPDGFTLPDWNAPFDVERALAQVPADATVKGMLYQGTCDDLRRRGFEPPGAASYHGFKDYPMREGLAFLVECARISHPDRSLPDALRRIGRPAYTTFADTLIGKVVFAALGREPAPIFKLAGKAFRHGTSHGKFETEIPEEGIALVHATEFHLTEWVGLGMVEGVLAACGRRGAVGLRRNGPADFDCWIRWD